MIKDKRIIVAFLIIILLFTTSIACAKSFDYETFNSEFEYLINQERESLGLQPVKVDTLLFNLANERSIEMAEYGNLRYVDSEGKQYAHVRPDGRQWYTVFNDNDIRYIGGIGENIAQIHIWDGTLDAKVLATRLFYAWKNSPSHYENMMFSDYKTFGLGFKDFTDAGNIKYGISTTLLCTQSTEDLRELNKNIKPVIPVEEKVIEKEPIKEDLIKEEVSVIEVVEIIEQPTQIPDPEVAQENPERVLCPECNMYHDCELMRALIDLVLWSYHD